MSMESDRRPLTGPLTHIVVIVGLIVIARYSPPAFLPFLLAYILFLLFSKASLVQDLPRRRNMARIAKQMGLAFDPAPEEILYFRFGHRRFRGERARSVPLNTITGVRTLAGRRVALVMGDAVSPMESEGGSRSPTSFAIFELPWVSTPGLLLRPEDFTDRAAKPLGWEDIDFEPEEFSRAFWVQSEDPQYAYALFHPRMMEYFLMVTPPVMEIVGDQCLLEVHRQEGTECWPPEAFLRLPTWFENFLELWPEHLTEKFEEREEAENSRGAARG